MKVDEAILLGPHSIQVVFFEAKQERLSHLHKAILVNENLLSCKALMTNTTNVEGLEGSATAVENAPEVTLLEGVDLIVLGPLLDLLGSILEGVFEDEVHLVLDGADIVLLLLLDLDEREEVVIFNVGPAFEESFEPFEIGLAGTGDHPHEVVLGISLAPEKSIAIVL